MSFMEKRAEARHKILHYVFSKSSIKFLAYMALA